MVSRSGDHGLLFFYILRKDDNGGGVGKCFAGERVSTECRDQRCGARLRSRPSMVSMAGGHSDRCTDKYDQSNTQTNIGNVTSMKVTKYGPGGVAQQIVVTGELGSVTVDTENKIRTALGGNGYTIEKQDGTVIDSMALLPSAFFTVEYQGGNYVLDGGGFGHGIGMSQNGANEMAKKGKNYLEILTTFYHDVEVR